MSDQILTIRTKPYLIRFLETTYGPQPIKFPKSNFNDIILYYVDFPPLDYKVPDYGDETLKIEIPYCEFKNIKSYNYLNPERQDFFNDEIYMFFRLTYRKEISKLLMMQSNKKDPVRKKKAIEMFMEKYNISMDSWDMLDQDYKRHIKLTWKTHRLRLNRNMSV